MKGPKLHPLNDRVAVRRVEAKDKTTGGILIPEAARERSIEAIVLAVGRGAPLESGGVREPSVKIGDRVLLGRYSGAEIEIDGQEAVVLSEGEILAILDG